MEAVNTSCLDLASGSYETYIPGDLVEPGTTSMPFYHDTDMPAPVLGRVEAITITLPLAEGQDTAATWAGTGFISGYTRATLEKNAVINGVLTWTWDGYTGPTFTPGTSTP